MTNLFPAPLRALWLALLLPALLLPSGWQWRLCFCEAMTRGEGELSCCASEELASEERGCCSEDEGVEQERHDCSECFYVEAGNEDLASLTLTAIPHVAPPQVIAWREVSAARPRERALERLAVGRAPPCVGHSLPLRI